MPMKLALLWILTPEAMNARLAERQKERMQEELRKREKQDAGRAARRMT